MQLVLVVIPCINDALQLHARDAARLKRRPARHARRGVVPVMVQPHLSEKQPDAGVSGVVHSHPVQKLVRFRYLPLSQERADLEVPVDSSPGSEGYGGFRDVF